MTIKSILDIAVTLPAEAIEDTIHALAELRQEMLPEVPHHAPHRISLIDEPHVKMAITNEGQIKLAVRSSGLGWLDIRLKIVDSHAAIVACIRSAGKVDANAGLFGPAGGNA